MRTPNEVFSTTHEELAHLREESSRAYTLQETPHKTLESATRTTLAAYAQAEAKDFLHETRVLPQHEAERVILKLKPETHDKNMEELFALMLDKGVKNALDVVAKAKNPHLEDDFHRFLVQYLHTMRAIPGLKPRDTLSDELMHTLFAVTLPGAAGESKDFKVFIQAMKQFYAGMRSITDTGSYYTLELAVQNHGRDIGIYASVPAASSELFEKLVHAYYPEALVDEVSDDYNIFSDTAHAITGSIATLSAPACFPLATDDTFSHDPESALISALSQLADIGEGAALQFVIGNHEQVNNALITSVITGAEKGGTKVQDLYKEDTQSITQGIGRGILAFFEKDKEEKPDTEKVFDTTGIELAKKKNGSQITGVTIRLIASAQTLVRAKTLVTTIESSFQQFALANSNALSWKEISTTKLPAFIEQFVYRTRTTNDELPLNVDELATLFHFPVGNTSTPELKESRATGAPAPTFSTSGIVLGTNDYRGKKTDVYFAPEDRVRHCYVIGQTGTGKTVFLKNMIIQDIKNGDGVCFIDPHGNDIEDILANIPPERIDDVIYFDPAYTARPMGLNMLEYDINYPEQKIFVINELLAIFNKLFDMKVAGGPMFEQYFRNAAGLVMEDPESGSTLLEIGRVMSDKAFRELKLSRCKNPIIKQFWINAERTTGEASLANFVPYITNKFDPFVSNDIMRPVIAQQHSVLNFREIMDKKKILLVNLSKGRLGDINSHLIGLLLVGKLTMAALSRVDIVGKGPVNDFYLYIDEFQNVTTDSIATILSEARKYRLSLTVAHQYIEQLDEKIRDAIFGNVGSMVIHRVSPENAVVFEKQLAPIVTPDDIIKLENLHCYIKMLVDGIPAKPFNSQTPFPPKGRPDIAEKIKELSYLTYGRPREEVEAEILRRYQ